MPKGLKIFIVVMIVVYVGGVGAATWAMRRDSEKTQLRNRTEMASYELRARCASKIHRLELMGQDPWYKRLEAVAAEELKNKARQEVVLACGRLVETELKRFRAIEARDRQDRVP